MTRSPDAEACRLDVWLWRARFFKTRSLACRFVEEGRVRLAQGSAEVRIDKPSRAVRPGDGLVFALGGRVFTIAVLGVGERRGPASEARELYAETLEPPADQPSLRA